jgi:DNA-binding GntR family transcriptional regulator
MTVKKTSSTSKGAKPDGRGQGAVRVYEALREDILSLDIPPGELLDEVQIGRRFDLSRSPVREALRPTSIRWIWCSG